MFKEIMHLLKTYTISFQFLKKNEIIKFQFFLFFLFIIFLSVNFLLIVLLTIF